VIIAAEYPARFRVGSGTVVSTRRIADLAAKNFFSRALLPPTVCSSEGAD
jgi:hypothetical protein